MFGLSMQQLKPQVKMGTNWPLSRRRFLRSRYSVIARKNLHEGHLAVWLRKGAERVTVIKRIRAAKQTEEKLLQYTAARLYGPVLSSKNLPYEQADHTTL